MERLKRLDEMDLLTDLNMVIKFSDDTMTRIPLFIQRSHARNDILTNHIFCFSTSKKLIDIHIKEF